jgi:hypothetical protein
VETSSLVGSKQRKAPTQTTATAKIDTPRVNRHVLESPMSG